MKTIIEDNKKYKLVHHTGMTRFQGCQCFKDCTCSSDFVSTPYDYYTVHKKFNRPKTTICTTIEKAHQKIADINLIPVNYYKEL